MSKNELELKAIEETQTLSDAKLEDARIEKFLGEQVMTAEQKDLFRLFMRVEKSRRQTVC